MLSCRADPQRAEERAYPSDWTVAVESCCKDQKANLVGDTLRMNKKDRLCWLGTTTRMWRPEFGSFVSSMSRRFVEERRDIKLAL